MCHQTVGLVARHLEVNGIATVVVGSARDIVEECGVARFLFTDFPLGNPFGKPWDQRMQVSILDMALALLECAWQPRTTIQTPYIWSEDESWRTNFMQVTAENREALLTAGAERRAEQARVSATVKKG